jgi:hypothetical protein
MKPEDEDAAMLAAYDEAQIFAADYIRKMGGDPAHPTREQAKALAKVLIERAALMKRLFDPDGPPLTADGVMRDYRKIKRMTKRRTQ